MAIQLWICPLCKAENTERTCSCKQVSLGPIRQFDDRTEAELILRIVWPKTVSGQVWMNTETGETVVR